MKTPTMLLLLLLLTTLSFAAWNVPPGGWDDIKFGLVNDNSEYSNRRIKEAVVNRGIQIDYRYVYLNGGVDKNSNRISWSFNEYQNYTLDSKEKVGAEAAYVVYMLQEEGGAQALKNVAADMTKMKQFFESIQIVAEYAAGKKSTWVIEPDTWGYVLQSNQSDTGSAFLENMAHINDLGIPHLAGFDNKISNIPQAIIAHVKHYAPDAYAGILMSFWSVDANLKVDEQYQVSGAIGFADWHMEAIEYSARVNLAFAEKLLPRDDYSKGDFIGVEKNGYDAGWWKVNGDKGDYYYWNEEQMRKWLRWSEILGKGLDLPLLGWQISIGHEGLPNLGSANSSNEIGNGQYEDTFFPFFFKYPEEFIDIGFIGFLVGKGLADGTDFTNSTDPLDAGKGDLGWFMDQLVEFDKGRPWLSGGAKRYTISASSNGNGTISPEGSVRVDSSKSSSFTFTPDSWHIIDSVLVDGQNVGTDNSYSFSNVTSNHSIEVYFGKDPQAPKLWTISTSAESNGTVSPSGNVLVENSSDTTLTIAASSGYAVDDVAINGISRGPIVSAKFFNVQSDHSLNATFKEAGGSYDPWDPSGSYPGTDTVSHNGSLWKNEWWANPGEEPGVNGVWTNIGPDAGGSDTTITAELEYRSATAGPDTLIITTTTTISGKSSIKVDTVFSDGSTEVKSSNQVVKKASLLNGGRLFIAPSKGNYSVAIYSLQGRQLSKRNLNISTAGAHPIPVDQWNLSSGVYILQLTGQGVQLNSQIAITR